MASADDNNGIPPMPALPPIGGTDGHRYGDELPRFFLGQNWPPTAAATGKHGHGATTMRRAFK
jgi:hypothetical protein